jgi:hypothetical protein
MKSARSVTVSGSISSQKGAFQIKNETIFAIGDAIATFAMNGVSAQLIEIGSTEYLNAPAALWTAGGISAAVAARLSGIWVKIPTTLPESLRHELSLSFQASRIAHAARTWSKGGTNTIDGQAVIAITSAEHAALYVATVGTPYPVRAVVMGPNGGTLTFSNWNGGSDPSAPAGAKTAQQLGLVPSAATTGTS